MEKKVPYKKWFLYSCLLIFSSPIAIVLVNYLVDPFSIFWRDYHEIVQPSERYNKIKFLDKNHSNYNAYMIGSSRIGTTQISAIEKYKPDMKFYNLTLGASTLRQHADVIRYMIKHHFPIKFLYLQVDIYDNFVTARHAKEILLYRFAPPIGEGTNSSFYRDYLLSFPFADLQRQIKVDLKKGVHGVRYDFEKTGCWYFDQKEKALQENPDEYMRNEPSFHKRSSKKLFPSNAVLSSNLRALKEITELCQKNHIELIVFVTPHNHVMLESIDFNAYQNFLLHLSDITPYWDFSGYNSITLNNRNYYEYSHYRPHVGEWIAERIFSPVSSFLPQDFGFFVTKETIQDHLNHLKMQYETYCNNTKLTMDKGNN
jgi:hypothetical protein